MDWKEIIGINAGVIVLILIIILVSVCKRLMLRRERSKNKVVDDLTFVRPTPQRPSESPTPDGRITGGRQQSTSSYITPATLPGDGRFVKQDDTRTMRETLSYETVEVQPAYDNLYDDCGNFNPRRVKSKGLQIAPRKRNNDKSNESLQENPGYQSLRFNRGGDKSLYTDYEIVQPQQKSIASNTPPSDRSPNEDPVNFIGSKSRIDDTSGYQDFDDTKYTECETASQRKKSSHLYTYITHASEPDDKDYVDLDM